MASRAQGPPGGGLGALPAESPEPRQGGSSPNPVCFSPALAVPGGQPRSAGEAGAGAAGHTPGPNFLPRGSGASGSRPFAGLVSVARRARPEARGRIHSRERSLLGVHPHSTRAARGPHPARERTGERRLGPHPSQSGPGTQSLTWGGGFPRESGTLAPPAGWGETPR